MSLIRLPYLGPDAIAEIRQTPNGFDEVDAINLYNNARLRNVRVVRVDILKRLASHFSHTTIENYRNVLYFILSGKATEENKATVNAFIKDVYEEDPIFRVKLGMIFYFRDSDLEKYSIFDALVIDTCRAIKAEMLKVEQELPHVKLIAESEMYLYFSISESLLPERYKNIVGLEVVSA